jgi:hypothetical protein
MTDPIFTTYDLPPLTGPFRELESSDYELEDSDETEAEKAQESEEGT